MEKQKQPYSFTHHSPLALREKLHHLSYQVGMITLKSLLRKMKTPSQDGKTAVYSIQNLDKEEKRILLEFIKMQVVPDRKLEALLIQSIKGQKVE